MKETIAPPKSTGLLIDPSTQAILLPRNNEVEALKRKLKNQHIVSLIGNPQSGKSTLLKHGLTPILDGELEGQNGNQWRIAITRPGISPIHNLADALSKSGVLADEQEMDKDYSERLRPKLERDGGAALVDAFEEAQLKQGQEFNLLIIVDRLEDIFRFEELKNKATNTGELAVFINLLLHAGRKKDIAIYLMLSLQANFVGRCAEYRGLAEAINENSHPLTPLSFRNIREGLKGIFDLKVPASYELFQRIVQDVKINEKDAFLLPKLQSILSSTIQYWEENRSNDEAIGLEHYPPINQFNEFLEYQADGLYESYASDPKAQTIIEHIFKALVQREEDTISRRPLLLSELFQLFPRESRAKVEQIIMDYHRLNPMLLEVINPSEIRRPNFAIQSISEKETVIDIKQVSLLNNWDNLQFWAQQEAFKADVYKRLFDSAWRRKNDSRNQNPMPSESTIQTPIQNPIAAVRSFSKEANTVFRQYFNLESPSQRLAKEEQQNKETVNLYTQPELGYVLSFDWESKDINTEHWAERYASSAFNIAMDFLEDSQKAERIAKNRALKKEQNQEKKDKRFLRFILFTAFVAILFAAWGIHQKQDAKASLTNLKLLNFIDALTDAQIIEFSKTKKLADLKKEIVNRNSINTREKVIQLLTKDSVGVLNFQKKSYLFDEKDETYYYDLLYSIDCLYTEESKMGINANLTNSRNAAIKAYDSLVKNDAEVYRQYPYAYKTMYAHLKSLRKRDPESRETSSKTHLVHRSLIQALASNPVIEEEFAFGDKQKKIYITKDLKLDSNTYTSLEAPSNITALTYSLDGTRIYVASGDGEIYYWDLYIEKEDSLHKIVPNPKTGTPFLISSKASIIHNLTSIKDDQYLIAATHSNVYLIDKEDFGKKGKKGKPIFNSKNEKSISSFRVNDAEDHFLIGVDGEVWVYKISNDFFQGLHPKKRQPIRIARIHQQSKEKPHEKASISAIGINSRNQVAIGSELGDIWILNTIPQSDTLFHKVSYHSKKQTSSISRLEFNTSGKQLASSSLDGTVILWNVMNLDDEEEHIQLKQNGHGIWSLCYKNDLELVVAENIHLNIWYSQAESLKQSLIRRDSLIRADKKMQDMAGDGEREGK